MLLTIITVVKNGQDHIRECLDKIKELRIYADFEYIVVDGKSKDSTVEICKDYEVDILVQEGSGIYNAMNQGVKAAKGDFILFVNADDFIDPSGLQRAIACLEGEPHMNHLFSVRLFNDMSATKVWDPCKTISRSYAMPAPHPGMIIKRSLLLTELRFSEDITSGSDYEMALKLIKRNDYCCHNIVVSNFRLGGTSSHLRSILENNVIRANSGLSFDARYKGMLYDLYQFIRAKL